MRRFAALFLALSSSAGCRFTTNGTDGSAATRDSNPPDSEDLAEAHAETSLDDTGVADTGADSFSDVAIESEADVTLPPLLEIVGVVLPGSTTPVNLTEEGTIAWAHWGLVDSGSFVRKAATESITNIVTFAGFAERWPDYAVHFTWSDGDPIATMPDTKAGIFIQAAGAAIRFEAIGNEGVRTLRVYVSINSAGAMKASLGDKSAPDVTAAIPPDTLVGNTPALYTIRFHSGTVGGRAVVTMTKAGGVSLGLLAATLQ